MFIVHTLHTHASIQLYIALLISYYVNYLARYSLFLTDNLSALDAADDICVPFRSRCNLGATIPAPNDRKPGVINIAFICIDVH